MNKYSIVSIFIGIFFVVGVYVMTQTSYAPVVDLEKEAAVGFQGQLSPTDAQDKIAEGYIVLDVRTPEEFISQRISDDALLIDFYADDFRTQLSLLDTNAPYVLHCRSGARSGKTVQIMKDMGFTNFYELAGGISAWQQAGLPVVSGDVVRTTQETNIKTQKQTDSDHDTSSYKDEGIICTADAKQCPDGSFVGRSGADCTFVCPQ